MSLMGVTNKQTGVAHNLKVTNNGQRASILGGCQSFTRTGSGSAFSDQTGVTYKSDGNGNIVASDGNTFKIDYVLR